MNFTAKDVQTLRERTGCGMMECKNALVEADGDMEKAIEVLREKGIAKQAKKAGRIAAEGVVATMMSEDGKSGVILEINAETDFVAKNADFLSFVDTVAKTILESNPADVDELATVKAYGTDMTIAELLTEKVLVIGENIKIRRFTKMDGFVFGYTHTGSRIAVLVKLDTDIDEAVAKTLAKNLALHITMYNPQYLSKADVPAEVVESEKKILMAQAMEEGKPANIAEKMVNGRIQKFYKETCLEEQGYILDEDVTVAKFLANAGAENGGTIKLESFVRYEKGEGIEKKQDNFADEVANMVK